MIENGGRQYKVSPGEKVALDLNGAGVGDDLRLNRVLLVSGDGRVRLGSPFLGGVSVTARVLGEAKGDKIIVFKKKRRKNYRRTRGHRQAFTVVEIKSIDLGAKSGTHEGESRGTRAKPGAGAKAKPRMKSEAKPKTKPSKSKAGLVVGAARGKAVDTETKTPAGSAVKGKVKDGSQKSRR